MRAACKSPGRSRKHGHVHNFAVSKVNPDSRARHVIIIAIVRGVSFEQYSLSVKYFANIFSTVTIGSIRQTLRVARQNQSFGCTVSLLLGQHAEGDETVHILRAGPSLFRAVQRAHLESSFIFTAGPPAFKSALCLNGGAGRQASKTDDDGYVFHVCTPGSWRPTCQQRSLYFKRHVDQPENAAIQGSTVESPDQAQTKNPHLHCGSLNESFGESRGHVSRIENDSIKLFGAGNGIRTRDFNLGNV